VDVLGVQLSTTPATPVYAIIRNAAGLVWNGSTLAAYATVNYAAYPIPLSQQGSASRYYTAAVPALPAGVYTVTVLAQASATPAVYSEANDLPLTAGGLDWTGTNITAVSSRLAPATADRTLAVDADGKVSLTTPAEAAGIPTTLEGMMRRVFERGTNERTRDRGTGVYALKNAAASGDLETALQSTSGNTDTIGASE